jgi:hypothetical protein
MTHKEKEMINTNRAVIVNFDGTFVATAADPVLGVIATQATTKSSVAYSNIYISFPVKEIHVRGIDIDWNSDYFTILFTSSLTDNLPLGAGFAGMYSDTSTSTKKLRYLFDQPRDINGTYTFAYSRVDKRSGAFTNTLTSDFPSASGGSVCFILEFVGYK